MIIIITMIIIIIVIMIMIMIMGILNTSIKLQKPSQE